jgi:hypothetical protein
MAVKSVTGIQFRAAKNFGDKMSNDAEVVLGHQRKYGAKHCIGWDFLVKRAEEGPQFEQCHPPTHTMSAF